MYYNYNYCVLKIVFINIFKNLSKILKYKTFNTTKDTEAMSFSSPRNVIQKQKKHT